MKNKNLFFISSILLLFLFSCSETISDNENKIILDSIEYEISNALSNRNIDSIDVITQNFINESRSLNSEELIAWSYFYRAKYYDYISDRVNSYKNYFLAENKFIELGKKYNLQVAIVKYNRGALQKLLGDYNGSEATIIESIGYIDSTGAYRLLSKCYEELGIISAKFNDYDNMKINFDKALYYVDSTDENLRYKLKQRLYNNMGNIWLRNNKYEIANQYFSNINPDYFIDKDRESYLYYLSNTYHGKLFIGDSTGVYKALIETNNYYDSLDLSYGKLMIKQYLADYYILSNNKKSANILLLESYKLANKLQNTSEELRIAEKILTSDNSDKSHLFSKYIIKKDSIENVDRVILEQYHNIKTEVRGVTERNKKISKQLYWLTFFVIIIGLFIISISLYIRERVKNKFQESDIKQNKLNKKLYILLLRKQQDIRENVDNERKRISSILHDQIQSKLMSIRLSLGHFIALGKLNKTEVYLNELQNVEAEIRLLSHDINKNLVDNQDYIQVIKEELKIIVPPYFKYYFEVDKSISWDDVDISYKSFLFTTIVEGVQNVVKHSKGNLMSIEISQTFKLLQLMIRDNGIGAVNVDPGMGLTNINIFVSKFGGDYSLKRNNKGGTILQVSIPIDK